MPLFTLNRATHRPGFLIERKELNIRPMISQPLANLQEQLALMSRRQLPQERAVREQNCLQALLRLADSALMARDESSASRLCGEPLFLSNTSGSRPEPE